MDMKIIYVRKSVVIDAQKDIPNTAVRVRKLRNDPTGEVGKNSCAIRGLYKYKTKFTPHITYNAKKLYSSKHYLSTFCG